MCVVSVVKPSIRDFFEFPFSRLINARSAHTLQLPLLEHPLHSILSAMQSFFFFFFFFRVEEFFVSLMFRRYDRDIGILDKWETMI